MKNLYFTYTEDQDTTLVISNRKIEKNAMTTHEFLWSWFYENQPMVSDFIDEYPIFAGMLRDEEWGLLKKFGKNVFEKFCETDFFKSYVNTSYVGDGTDIVNALENFLDEHGMEIAINTFKYSFETLTDK